MTPTPRLTSDGPEEPFRLKQWASANPNPANPANLANSANPVNPANPANPADPANPAGSGELFPGLAALVSELKRVQERKRYYESLEQELFARADNIAFAGECARENALTRATEAGPNETSIRSVVTSGIAYRSVQAELAPVCGVTDRTMAGRMEHACKLVNDYASVHRSFAQGEISFSHTRIIVDEGLIIGDHQRREVYEAAVLDEAKQVTTNRLRPIARRLAADISECTIEERFEEAAQKRFIQITPLDDGMASLFALLPAVEAYAIWDKLSQEARIIKQLERDSLATASRDRSNARNDGSDRGGDGAEDDNGGDGDGDGDGDGAGDGAGSASRLRTNIQIRTDLLCDALLRHRPSFDTAHPDDSRSTCLRVGAKVQVVIPVMTLIGDTPQSDSSDGVVEARTAYEDVAGLYGTAQLAGYGPIDPATARRLAGAAAGWDRVLVHPITGTVLEVDRYRPSEDMRRLLSARDQHCRFPGCRMPTWRCDIDHTLDHANGGRTAVSNLAHLCRSHHTLKHHGGWKVKQEDGGVLDWESPAKNRHIDRPTTGVMFRPIPDVPTNDNAPPVNTLGRKSAKTLAPRNAADPPLKGDNPQPPF